MMLTTHALVGALLAVPVALVAPEYAPAALVAGFVGGSFPDLDVLARHRRTLHFPRYYGFAAAAVVPAVLAYPSAVTVAAFFFLAAAWAHSVADIAGGGPEPRPWEARSNRAVYDHFAGRWYAPRRWVRYDGAPEDLAIAVVVALPVAYVAPLVFLYAVAAALVVSAAYTVFRKRVVPVAERVETVSLVDD